jgi:hypothetical protein
MSFGLWWSRFCPLPRASVAVGGVITVRSLKRSRGGSGQGLRGGTCPRTWCPGRRRGNATAAGRSTAPTPKFSPPSGAHGINNAKAAGVSFEGPETRPSPKPVCRKLRPGTARPYVVLDVQPSRSRQERSRCPSKPKARRHPPPRGTYGPRRRLRWPGQSEVDASCGYERSVRYVLPGLVNLGGRTDARVRVLA